MTTSHTNFTGADYAAGSNLDFRDPRYVEFLAEGARGGYAVHFGSTGRIAYLWPADRVAEAEMQAYRAYVKACMAEDLEAFGLHQWRVQGNPDGPIG